MYAAPIFTEVAMEKVRHLLLISGLVVISLGLLTCQGPAPRSTSMLTVVPTLTHSLPLLPSSSISASATVPSAPRVIPSQACRLADLPIANEMLWQLDRFAWSPTGDRLAYVGPAESADALTGSLMLVTAPHFNTPQPLAPSAVGDPTWSPDGSQIAFVAFRSDDQQGTIMVINTDGSGLLDLLPEDAARTDPGIGFKAIEGWWDETHLLVATNCGAGCRRPMMLDLQAHDLKPILPAGQEGSSYAWSPNRTFIAVTSGVNPQIGVISQGEEIFWLSGHGAPDSTWTFFWTFFADWSPDSAHMLFIRQPSDGSAPPELWAWNTETRESSMLLLGVIAARWSPRGDRIAFVTLGQPRFGPDGKWQGVDAAPQGPNPIGIGLYRWPEGEIITFFEAGEVDFGYRYLVESSQSLAPVWSPDGRQLVYSDGRKQAWVLSVDEWSQYEVPTRGHPTDEARWSSDGKRLALRVSDSLQIFAIPCSP